MDLINITNKVFANMRGKRKNKIDIEVPFSLEYFCGKYGIEKLFSCIIDIIYEDLLSGKFNTLLYVIMKIVRFFKTYRHKNPFKATDAIFFYMQASVAFGNIIEYNETLVNIVLAYAYSDNDIDDIEISYQDRVELSNDMIESCMTEKNKFDGGRAIIASKLKQYPNIKQIMYLTMKEQHRSILVQSSSHIHIEELKDVCFRKGAYTSLLVLYSIVPNPSDNMKEYAVICGIIGQMLDDLVDIEDDTHDNVNTYATEVFKRDSNLDDYIRELLGIYQELVEHECATDFIKDYISRLFIITAVYRNTNKISKEMYTSFSFTVSYFATNIWYFYKLFKVLGTVVVFKHVC
tara:strand:+ start:366 stop:1409 length:1044 start_codon:yes stop_codon:yes gene_type:complete